MVCHFTLAFSCLAYTDLILTSYICYCFEVDSECEPKSLKNMTALFCSHCSQENFAITWIKIKNEYTSISVRTLQFVPCYKKESNIVNKCYCICSLGFSSCYCMKPASWSYVNVSMTSLLVHTVAQPTKWRFLSKNFEPASYFCD